MPAPCVALERVLVEAWASEEKLVQGMVEKGVEFTFIPVETPHWAGSAGRSVRTVKKALKGALFRAQVATDEQLLTFFSKVSALVNSRPLVEVGAQVLTPAMLLKPVSQSQPFPRELTGVKLFKHVQQVFSGFRKVWQTLYLQSLSHQVLGKEFQLAVGDLVMVQHPRSWFTMDWVLGRITKLFPGRDGIPRAAMVQCQGKEVYLSVTKLSTLEGVNQGWADPQEPSGRQ